MRLTRSSSSNMIEKADERHRKSETMGVSDEDIKPAIMNDAQKEINKKINVTQNVRLIAKSASLADGNVTPSKVIFKKRQNFCVFGKRADCKKCSRHFNVSLEWLDCGSCLCTHQNHFSCKCRDSRTLLNFSQLLTGQQQQPRRFRSSTDISISTVKGSSHVFHNGIAFDKYKRSLKLLGFEPSDFGAYCRKEEEATWKKKKLLPTLSTKVIRRTTSLDSVREAVREAWADNCLDFHHRKLLSQAAYEEWYFRKERELQTKQEENKIEEFRRKAKIFRDNEMKKDKAQEEFRKWVLRKSTKRKEKDDKNSMKTFEKSFGRAKKTREEREKAFLRWKKEKDKELRENDKKKKREEETKKESERQKKERKIVAEKAFQQWKNKLYEWQKFEKEKKQKKQEKLGRRQKREKESQIAFQIWKTKKDEAIRQKTKEMK